MKKGEMSEAGGERGGAGEEPRECWPGRSAHPGPRRRGGGGGARRPMASGAVVGAGQAPPGPRLPRPLTAKLTNSALAPAGAGSPEPGPDQRTWQQREKAGAGSWPPLLCRSASAPGALRASCLAGLPVAAGLFPLERRAARTGTPTPPPQPGRSGRGLCVRLAGCGKLRARGREPVPGCGGAGARG